MKAEELRIGNYLKYPNTVHFEIELDDFLSKNFWNDISDGIIQHILLTEEWLLKFGFHKDNDRYFNKAFCLHIDYDEDSVKSFTYIPDTVNEFKVKRVNQLQNLYFALTQKELEIK